MPTWLLAASNASVLAPEPSSTLAYCRGLPTFLLVLPLVLYSVFCYRLSHTVSLQCSNPQQLPGWGIGSIPKSWGLPWSELPPPPCWSLHWSLCHFFALFLRDIPSLVSLPFRKHIRHTSIFKLLNSLFLLLRMPFCWVLLWPVSSLPS